MSSKDSKNDLKEFTEFLGSSNTQVPAELRVKVLKVVQELLHPSPWVVFAKILGIHVFVGFLSLSICHQFEINPFGTQTSLSDFFMNMWGHSTCMLLCGGLFLGASILTAGFFLTIEEVRALKQTKFIQSLALSGFSLGIFAIFGAELAITFAGLWLLGAIVGGFVATEAVFKLKSI